MENLRDGIEKNIREGSIQKSKNVWMTKREKTAIDNGRQCRLADTINSVNEEKKR